MPLLPVRAKGAIRDVRVKPFQRARSGPRLPYQSAEPLGAMQKDASCPVAEGGATAAPRAMTC
ncbi:MAG: hypothetical protein JWR56_2534 [Massilia sp.]|jgi:hypothetical protein|nr:hypothetical protein [Massilia sp.]